MGLGFALWSLATALTGLAGGFGVLLGFRVLLGVGETVAFPSMSKLLAQAVPPAQLGLANGFTTSGVYFGPAIGVLAGGLIIAAVGWRPMFLLFGVIALLWLPPWTLHGRSARATQPAPQQPPPYRAILNQRGLWGTTLGQFCFVYGLYFMLAWMPLWLVEQHGYSVIAMARLLALSYAASGTAAVFFGWTCDRLIGSGWSITVVRKSASILAHVGGAAGLLGCAVGNPRTRFAWEPLPSFQLRRRCPVPVRRDAGWASRIVWQTPRESSVLPSPAGSSIAPAHSSSLSCSPQRSFWSAHWLGQ